MPRTKNGISRLPAALAAALAAGVVLTACSGEPAEDAGATAQPSPAQPSPTSAEPDARGAPSIQRFDVPAGAGPHDVAPAADGGVWFTAQQAGYLGHLDPQDGRVTRVPLGSGSAPHGVITGPDDAAWVTDGGLNAIVRVDETNRQVRRFPLPADRPGANLNTATFDGSGILWFTGQNGIYGRLDPDSGELDVYDAPRGTGPYGITTTPDGEVFYASLAGSHIARIATDSGEATVLEPPTEGQGARRVWSDSKGIIWVSEYNSGKLGRYDPGTREWQEWDLPGDAPQPYAVFVDQTDMVWLSDFGSDRLLRFDPATETFTPARGAAPAVRQIHGRAGEVWGAASGDDELLLIRTGTG
jgi:virginiamycin B lyase